MIDSYIYQLNAAYLRYRVLLRDVKALTSDEVHQTPHIDSEIHIPTFDLETRALSDLSRIKYFLIVVVSIDKSLRFTIPHSASRATVPAVKAAAMLEPFRIP